MLFLILCEKECKEFSDEVSDPLEEGVGAGPLVVVPGRGVPLPSGTLIERSVHLFTLQFFATNSIISHTANCLARKEITFASLVRKIVAFHN